MMKDKIDVKLILIDLDHTLIGFGHPQLSSLNKQAIQKVQSDGKEVVICTGRSFVNSIHYARELNLNYHLCFNGAFVYDLNKEKVIYINSIKKKKLQQMILSDVFSDTEVFTSFYCFNDQTQKVHSFYCGESNPDFKKHKIGLDGFVKLNDLTPLLSFSLFKMNIFAAPNVLDRFILELERVAQLHIVRNYPNVLEVTNIGVNKARGAKFLTDHLQISPQQTMSIGDSYNDLVLFQFVGYGIAVANAVDDLKKISYGITAAHNQSGVGKAIIKWVLKKE